MQKSSTPPFEEIQEIMALAGYRVISIGAEHTDMRFSGVINVQIAPASWAVRTDFVNFPQISQDFLVNIRKCAAQYGQQESGTG